MITFPPTYKHICYLIEACQHDEVANQERETSNWIVNIKGIVTHFYGIANDEAMTNKEMRKKGCSSLQKKNLIASKCYSFRCASVDPWDGSIVVLGQLTKRALDQSSYVTMYLPNRLLIQGYMYESRGQNTRR